ncbi:MAG TPA: MATE family efflux transporter [Deltaproteobacteria bacterium]|nr:MATE family efflux transporter [Deltaproteobacteria bacterium]HPR53666.1 MATE family efflux transporter [Deltaproteobacteria bacterium]HXK47182.1 MATE family efflux transporter [Deltaproteobacteria bacterium]
MSKLIDEGVNRTIVRMAVPMLAGTFAMNTYQLTNAWFVSRLGTDALAAISFTFPVVMLLMFLTRGLGSGALTLVAHALGGGDRKRAAALTTHALILAVLFAVAIAVIGLITIVPVFSRLGASGEVLDLTARYMRTWYLGAVVMVLQMVVSDIIISTGNTKAVSLLMVGSTVVNVFFDMGLIFGMFGMPRMGIVGAAWATILAQGSALAVAVYILARRMRLVDPVTLAPGPLLRSWGGILTFGVPGALGMILTPISAAVITRLVSGYGNAAVAATGVASRIEMFAFMVPMTVGMSLIPFVAQNYGAGRLDRIRRARRGAMTFAVLYGVFIGVLFIVFARDMARIFSDQRDVIDVLSSYIRITCMGYGMLEVHRYAGFTMTGAHEPVKATVLNVIRVVVLLIPLSVVGGTLFHLKGIFMGRFATDILAGLVGIWWTGRMLSEKERSAGTQAGGSA